MLPSFDKVIKNPTIDDVGYELHMELLAHFEKERIKPIVLDSKKVLLDPKKTLGKLCNLIGISFDGHMLYWKAGARPEDGTWAKYWYGNIHKATGFIKYEPNIEPFPDHLKPMLQSCLPYYKELVNLAI